MDSESEILTLPEQIYIEGEESIALGTVQQYSDWNLVSKVEEALGECLFQKIRSSFLGLLVELGPKMKAKKGIRFSGKIFHYLMQQRVKTKGSTLWFRVDSQPIRFSLREFYLTTGIQCEPVHRELRRKGKDPVKEPYFWASKGSYTLGDLEDRLFLKPKEGEPAVEDEEKLCLAAVVLTEGILLTPYGKEKIPLPRLRHASDFEMYTAQPWGKEAFSVLSNSILRMDEKTWAKEKYDLRGFGLALTIWVLSAVPAFGAAFGVKDKEFQSEYPLILKWKSTTTPEFFKIVNLVNDVYEFCFLKICNVIVSSQIEVNTIIGNPEDFKSLVPDFHTNDTEFQQVLELVKMGYRLKKTEWNTRCVDVCAALEEAEEEGGLERKAENDNESFEDSIREPNTQYGSYPGDDENTQCDVGDEVAEESSKDKSPTPRSSTPNFNILSEESLDVQKDKKRSSRGRNENKRVKPSVHAEDNLKTRKQVPRKRQKQVDSADVDVPTRKEHVDAALELMKTRKESNPELFKNKSVVFVGSSFLNVVDESYMEFLDNKEGFQFQSEEISKLIIEEETKCILAPFCIKGKCWVALLIHLEQKTVCIWEYAASYLTEEVKKKYVAAYSIAMPYIVRNILKKEDMDVSPFSIKVLTTFPQAPRNEESGIYMLKFMECYSMYTSHSNLEGNIIQNVRNKLAADIYTELGSVTL
ncbi:T2L5.5 gene product [Arabidopsis thaliana]|uniref:T2L5.5 protein n=1 Tax=Arabidopsis thaliana TaxID=3702 RepID=O82602_ARATH|nr:T2L5.5 gene product [Arabidopsis thaliana]